MNAFHLLLTFISSQESPTQNVDHPDWQYWVAIASLSATVGTLFGLLLKSHSTRVDELKAANKEHNDASEAKAKLVAAEFERKDKALLDISVSFASLMEKVATELATLNRKAS